MGRKRKAGAEDEVAQAAPEVKRGPQGGGQFGGLDPDIVELCDHFHIDEYHTKKLQETMQTRPDTFEEDMIRLWTDLEEARNPNGLLVHHMKQMEEGSFVGQCKPDPEMVHIGKKYELDKEANKRLTDCICRHTPEKRQAYYIELELHLDASNRPSAAAMMLLRKIKDGEPLGQPTRKGSGKGDRDRDEGKGGKGGRRDDGYDRRDDGGRGRSRSRGDRRDDYRDRDRGRDSGYDRGGRGSDDRGDRGGDRRSDRDYDRDRRDGGDRGRW